MQSEDYRRLYIAFLKMADHSNVPDERARWRAMAMTCLKQANELQEALVKHSDPVLGMHRDQERR